MWMGLALSLLGFVSASSVLAARQDDKTVLTFSQPVEIPGHVLPAGTYTFKLVDSMSDRHIVQVFNADGSEIIATVMAIPDYRLTPTDETVIKFSEVPAGFPGSASARGSIPATPSGRCSCIRRRAPCSWRRRRRPPCPRLPLTPPTSTR